MNRTDCLEYPARAPLYLARMHFEWAAIHGTAIQFQAALRRYLEARREVA